VRVILPLQGNTRFENINQTELDLTPLERCVMHAYSTGMSRTQVAHHYLDAGYHFVVAAPNTRLGKSFLRTDFLVLCVESKSGPLDRICGRCMDMCFLATLEGHLLCFVQCTPPCATASAAHKVKHAILAFIFVVLLLLIRHVCILMDRVGLVQ
jgi:hypothetical protein